MDAHTDPHTWSFVKIADITGQTYIVDVESGIDGYHIVDVSIGRGTHSMCDRVHDDTMTG